MARRWSMNPEIQAIGEAAEYAATVAAQLRRDIDPQQWAIVKAEHAQIQAHLKDVSTVLQSLSGATLGGGNGNPDVQRVEQIPGRRMPFEFLTEIAIPPDTLTELPGTITIDQSGPFIAESRIITFLSQYQFQFRDPESQQVFPFLGRSNGRFRPVSSMQDILDGQLPADVTRVVAFPGTGDPSYSSPALHSPYRTMEFDARITLRALANSYPRSNIPVPTSMWTTNINNPFPLAALDFFGRNEVIELRVTPQHTNNPRAGNLQAFAAAGSPYPYLDAQYDHHEGIADPYNAAVTTSDPDPVTRVPVGILIAGFKGYRIIQPAGAVVNIGMV